VLLLGLVTPGLSQSPKEMGLSPSGVKRLADRLNEGVAKGEIPGAVVLVMRNGKVEMFEAFGYRDREAGAPMPKDAIFRIASMTKPITSVAAMMLVEQGKLALDDPVAKYVPAFADTKVAVKRENSDGTEDVGQEPQQRQMTILDLLRHYLGPDHRWRRHEWGAAVVRLDAGDGSRPDQRRDGRPALAALAALPAWHALGIFAVDRRVGPRDRSRVRACRSRGSSPNASLGRLKLVDTGFEVSADKKSRGAVASSIPDVTWDRDAKVGREGLVFDRRRLWAFPADADERRANLTACGCCRRRPSSA